MKKLLFILACITFYLSVDAQVYPYNFPPVTTPTDSMFVPYQIKSGSSFFNRKIYFTDMKDFFGTNVQTTLIAYTPTATGNTLNLGEIVEHATTGEIWSIDRNGDAKKLNDPTEIMKSFTVSQDSILIFYDQNGDEIDRDTVGLFGDDLSSFATQSSIGPNDFMALSDSLIRYSNFVYQGRDSFGIIVPSYTEIAKMSGTLAVDTRIKVWDTGAEYLIKSDSLEGFETDEFLVITVGSNYAILQPYTGSSYSGKSLGLVNDATISYTGTDNAPLLNKAMQFVGNAAIGGSNSSGQDLFRDTTYGGEIVVERGSYLFEDSVSVYSGIRIRGSSALNTQFLHNPSAESDFFVTTDGIGEHYSSRWSAFQLKDIQLVGNVVGSTGAGTSRYALHLNGMSNMTLDNVQLNRWDTAVVITHTSGTVATYYNRFINCVVEHVKSGYYFGENTAVSYIEGGRVVGTGKFDASLDSFAIVNYSGLTAVSTSFEGAWKKAKFRTVNSRLKVVGGRSEGENFEDKVFAVVESNPTSPNAAHIDISLDNGPTGILLEMRGIDSAPSAADLNNDQSAQTNPVNIASGAPTQIKVLSNEDFNYGLTDWSPNGTAGRPFSMFNRDSLFGAPAGLKYVKTSASGSVAYSQRFNLNSPKTVFTVWVKKTSGAVIQLQISSVYAADNSTNGFKEFTPYVVVGDWVLYRCEITNYNPNTQPLDYQLTLGLKSTSTTNSTATFCNINTFVGGFNVFAPYSIKDQHYLDSAPTSGFIEADQPLLVAGENYTCTNSVATTSAQSYSAGATEIRLSSVTGIAEGDLITLNCDLIQNRTTVVSVSGDTVTIAAGLSGGMSSGNLIYCYRVEKVENTVFYSTDNLSTFTPDVRAKSGDWALDTRLGAWYYYNGSSWAATGPANRAAAITVAATVTNATLTPDLSTHTKFQSTATSTGTYNVNAPSGSPSGGEEISITLTAGSGITGTFSFSSDYVDSSFSPLSSVAVTNDSENIVFRYSEPRGKWYTLDK